MQTILLCEFYARFRGRKVVIRPSQQFRNLYSRVSVPPFSPIAALVSFLTYTLYFYFSGFSFLLSSFVSYIIITAALVAPPLAPVLNVFLPHRWPNPRLRRIKYPRPRHVRNAGTGGLKPSRIAGSWPSAFFWMSTHPCTKNKPLSRNSQHRHPPSP